MANTKGVLAILTGLALLWWDKSSSGANSNNNANTNNNNSQNAPPGNSNNGSNLPPQYTNVNNSNLNLNFTPYNSPPALPSQILTDTQVHVQIPDFSSIANAISACKALNNVDPSVGNNDEYVKGYRTGWRILISPVPVTDGSNAFSQNPLMYGTEFIQPGYGQIALYVNGWTPDTLWNQRRDAITTYGQLFGLKVSPLAPDISDVSIDWSNPSDDILKFVTGYMYLSDATKAQVNLLLSNAETNTENGSNYSLINVLKLAYMGMLTIPEILAVHNALSDIPVVFNGSIP